MRKKIELKEGDFVLSVKPNCLNIQVISEVKNDTVDIYYELIYNHYEQVIHPPVMAQNPDVIYNPITNQFEPNPDAGGVQVISEERIEDILKNTIILYSGNETIPTQYLIPLLSGDKEVTNQILASFQWYGLFDGFVMEVK